jgi:hypothetical protein
MESVEELLKEKGLLPIDWILTRVNAITPNGSVLIGTGQHKVHMENGDCGVHTHAWRAVIPKGNLF